MRLNRVLSWAIVLTLFVVPRIHAADPTNAREFAFSGPVQVGDMTLPAGTYIFMLDKAGADRHLVRIFDETHHKELGGFTTKPVVLKTAAPLPMVMFGERPDTKLPAIKKLYFPGNRTGEEFIYSEDDAMRLAAESHKSVLTKEGRVVEAQPVATSGSEKPKATDKVKGKR